MNSRWITKRVTLTANIVVHLDGDELASDMEWTEALGRALDSWSDGRYPFNVEMLHVGLEQVLERSLVQAVEGACYAKLGNRPELSGFGTSRSVRFAELKLKRLKFLKLDGGSIAEAQIGEARPWKRGE